MTKYEEFKALMESRFNELVERKRRLLGGDMSDCQCTESEQICAIRLNAEIERLQWVLEMMPSDPNELTDVMVIDVDQAMWDEIKSSAEESQWMPKEYVMNDWVSDVCNFLRNGPMQQTI